MPDGLREAPDAVERLAIPAKGDSDSNFRWSNEERDRLLRHVEHWSSAGCPRPKQERGRPGQVTVILFAHRTGDKHEARTTSPHRAAGDRLRNTLSQHAGWLRGAADIIDGPA